MLIASQFIQPFLQSILLLYCY